MILNIAHRGYSAKYPENTMLAFEKAIAAGADGIELDVQETLDGHVVIMHDERVDRTTDGTGFIKDMTLSAIEKLNASASLGKSSLHTPVPTLEAYCAYVCDMDIMTNIEMKTGVFEYKSMERKVYDIVCRYRLQNKTVISSFNHHTILRMKAFAPELTYGFLTSDWLINPGAYAKKHDIPCYHPDFRSLTEETVRGLKSHGIKINCYTVNEPEDVLAVARLGVDAIIGNEVARTGRLLREP